jgi:hypothetical protein
MQIILYNIFTIYDLAATELHSTLSCQGGLEKMLIANGERND